MVIGLQVLLCQGFPVVLLGHSRSAFHGRLALKSCKLLDLDRLGDSHPGNISPGNIPRLLAVSCRPLPHLFLAPALKARRRLILVSLLTSLSLCLGSRFLLRLGIHSFLGIFLYKLLLDTNQEASIVVIDGPANSFLMCSNISHHVQELLIHALTYALGNSLLEGRGLHDILQHLIRG